VGYIDRANRRAVGVCRHEPPAARRLHRDNGHARGLDKLHSRGDLRLINIVQQSLQNNVNTGPAFAVIKGFSRPVPARPADFYIAGRTHCAAPIMEMVGTVRLVGGDVEFTPKAGGHYVLKGELQADHSAVWIEDVQTGARVSEKLRIEGSAKAGLFGVKGIVEHLPVR